MYRGGGQKLLKIWQRNVRCLSFVMVIHAALYAAALRWVCSASTIVVRVPLRMKTAGRGRGGVQEPHTAAQQEAIIELPPAPGSGPSCAPPPPPQLPPAHAPAQMMRKARGPSPANRVPTPSVCTMWRVVERKERYSGCVAASGKACAAGGRAQGGREAAVRRQGGGLPCRDQSSRCCAQACSCCCRRRAAAGSVSTSATAGPPACAS